MIEYIYVCRHGFRSNWVDSSITTSPTGMQRDPPLASYGLEQSRHLARFLADPEHKGLRSSSDSEEDAPGAGISSSSSSSSPSLLSSSSEPSPPPPEIVFSSPFYRCIQTSLAYAELLHSSRTSSTALSTPTPFSDPSSSSSPTTPNESQNLNAIPTAVHLEHGIQEWYSAVKPSTGLHPRPARAGSLRSLFPEGLVLGESGETGQGGKEGQVGWTSTFWPSREGEGLEDLNDRVHGCLDALIPRIESTYPSVRSVVLYGHAASVIAIGRALTGDPKLEVRAGCASTSLYRRKRSRAEAIISATERDRPLSTASTVTESTFAPGWDSGSTTSAGVASTGLANNENGDDSVTTARTLRGQSEVSTTSTSPGIGKTHLGEWDALWNGRADYLPNGEERNWSFADILLNEAGDVIHDDGDHVDHDPADALPVGLDDAALRFSSGHHLRYRPAHRQHDPTDANERTDGDENTLVHRVGDVLGINGSKL